MFGFLIGAASLFGLYQVTRGYGGRCGYGGRGWHGGHHRFGRRGGRFRGRWLIGRISELIDATPGQEKVIAAAIDQVQEVFGKLRAQVEERREELAEVLGAEKLDEAALNAVFNRGDAVFQELRGEVTAALKNVHEALDPRQRKILAELIEEGFAMFRGGWARRGCGPQAAAQC